METTITEEMKKKLCEEISTRTHKTVEFGTILYENAKCINREEFDKKVLNKKRKNILFVMKDSNGNIVGGYLDSNIDGKNISKDSPLVIEDDIAFTFIFKQNGNVNICPIKKSESKNAFCLYPSKENSNIICSFGLIEEGKSDLIIEVDGAKCTPKRYVGELLNEGFKFETIQIIQMKVELKFLVKTPKGTRDYLPKTMNAREVAIETIKKCYKRHGAVTIDTPVFELKDVLTSKYGEEGGKLIYDLADQGEGEKLSMRYDLTVPFARYIATNGIKKIKRYHIGKVYRRDQPYMTRGRQREFCQCDFDIAGEFDPMIPDAEIVCIMNEVLTDLEIGQFKIKLNHRMLLDAIFDLCGVSRNKFSDVFSSVDKLDKMSWEDVEKEMVETKGIDKEVVKKIGEYVRLHDKPWVMYNKLKEMELNNHAKGVMDEMKLLFEYCDSMKCLDNVEFDLSLVRGLDYYTGVIFEAVMMVGNTSVGSIAGGGRYDDLVGIFGENKIPCVGFAIGLERIMIILEEKMKQTSQLHESSTEVFVASIDNGKIKKRLEYLSELWNAGINAETIQKLNPKIKQELREADDIGCQFAVIFGEQEVEQRKVILKNLITNKQMTINEDQLIPALVYRIMHKDIYKKEDPEMFATEEEIKFFRKLRHELNISN